MEFENIGMSNQDKYNNIYEKLDIKMNKEKSAELGKRSH